MSKKRGSLPIAYKEAIGLILITLLGAFYYLINPSIIHESETKTIKVMLNSTPNYSEPSEESSGRITFKAGSYERKFDISGCAIDLLDIETFLTYSRGEPLTLIVNASELNMKDRPLIYSPIHVYGITLSNGAVLLSLKDYNQCERDTWKGLFYLALIVIAGLLLAIIWESVKQTREKRRRRIPKPEK